MTQNFTHVVLPEDPESDVGYCLCHVKGLTGFGFKLTTVIVLLQIQVLVKIPTEKTVILMLNVDLS